MYPQKAEHRQRDSHPLYHSCVRTVAVLGRTDLLPRTGRLINQNLNSGKFQSLISSRFFFQDVSRYLRKERTPHLHHNFGGK